MNPRLTVFLFIVWLLAFLFLLHRLKTRRADIRFVLPWLMLDLAMMVITAFPGILDTFCALVGIETPSNMLFFFALLFLAALVCSLTLSVSRLNAQVKDLTQRLALREQQEISCEGRDLSERKE